MGIHLEHLTWLEAEPVLKSGRVVVLPIGARLKEHGPHLPLNNDWLTCEYLARRLVERLDVIMLPTIPFGYYPAFVDYPGSVHVGLEAFRDYVVDVCRSVARHGAKKIYALNNGVSTNHALAPARAILAAEGILFEYTILAETNLAAKAQVKTQREGTHADELETSMMLYLAPSVVKMDKATTDYVWPTKSGIFGDATRATREKGEVLTEAMVEELVAFLTRFGRTDYQPTIAPAPRQS